MKIGSCLACGWNWEVKSGDLTRVQALEKQIQNLKDEKTDTIKNYEETLRAVRAATRTAEIGSSCRSTTRRGMPSSMSDG